MSATGLRSRSKKAPAGLRGARKAEFPAFIEPCDPSLRQRAPAGDDWVYEVKADGYRSQIHVHDGKVTAYSRTGLNWTDQFSLIVEAAKHLSVRQVVLDGEAVVYGANGMPDFQAMRRATGAHTSAALRYHAFDLLYLDGQYLAAEYEGRASMMGEPPLSRRGWGHSTVEACVATAVAAGAKVLHVGHREPKRDDFDLARIDAYLQQCVAAALAGTGRQMSACIPQEGLTVQV